MTALLKIEDLQVEAQQPTGERTRIVKGVSLEIARGEVVALIGESGAGKSTIALSTLGYARPGCQIVGGRVLFNGADILQLDATGKRDLRGRAIAYVAQSAAASFNAAIDIEDQVIESPLLHGLMSRAEAKAKAVDLYRRLQLPDPEHIGAKYPHQVSGGQLQRLMAAMAMACSPDLLIFDEPTTAIDVTTQVEVLTAFKDVIKRNDMAAIYVSHDLAVVAQMADRIVVLYGGQIVEQGTTEQILQRPKEAYTKLLMAAIRPPPNAAASEAQFLDTAKQKPLLAVDKVTAGYGGRKGRPAVTVLRDVDFEVYPREVVGVIGESGCGKSTLARVIAGLLPAASGDIRLDGASLPSALRDRSKADLKRIQIVFQSPDVSFNPRKRIRSALGRPLEFYLGMKGAAKDARISELLKMVELPPHYADRMPAELSGGEKQRINLARALAAQPEIVLCDEVTSSLDTVVGAAIVELLKSLQKDLGSSFVFISHDISTVASFANRITVLYAGRVAEQGVTGDVLAPPYHPYTRLLLSSVPELRQGWLEDVRNSREALSGQNQSIENTTEGCPFFNRCPLAIRDVCDKIKPPVHVLARNHTIACHREIAELN
ncbi:MAG: ABC transporter ATP-binding protein [Pseudorhodoplanes sp.]